MRFSHIALAAVSIAGLVACSTVPMTGRKQVNLVSSSEMTALAAQEYGQFLKENPPSKDAAATERVRGVGERIRRAVESYMSGAGLGSRLAGYQWQFNLVDNEQVNAWCMPGGRVVVYSGLLPVAKDDTGLAVVMGHEIAHAIAEHGSERMSQQMLAQLGGVALEVALQEKPNETRAMWQQAYGVGAQVGALLPFSRVQESEADRLGLIFMAMAGYDPRQAPDFWKRMASAKGGGAPPEFLSTHPSDATRIRALEELVPEALKSYRPQG